MGSSSREVLNHATHSRVANSTSPRLRHGPRCRMISVLKSPMTDFAIALSYESPLLPTEGAMPASANRSVYLIERYCITATGVQYLSIKYT